MLLHCSGGQAGVGGEEGELLRPGTLVGKCLCTLEGFASSRGNERRKELPSPPPVLPIFKSKRVPAGAGSFLSFLEIDMCVSEHCLI